jgi:hypothetical protein
MSQIADRFSGECDSLISQRQQGSDKNETVQKGVHMNGKVTDLKTDAELLRSLKEAAQHKPTKEEKLEQRVSFVVGSLKSDSDMTREQVKRLVEEEAAE